MDYGRLSRRELQSLCKEHGIPANKTNVFMVEALGALLNAPKETHMEESAPDPAEVVVKARGRRHQQDSSKDNGSNDLAPGEIEDLSSHLAHNNLQGGEPAEDDVSGKQQIAPDKTDEIALEIALDANNVAEAEIGKEKSRKTKPRPKKSKKAAKPNDTVENAAPIDNEMEVLGEVDVTSFTIGLTRDVDLIDDLSSRTNAIPAVVSETSSTEDAPVPAAVDSLVEEQSKETAAAPKPAAKKGRAKGRKAKTVKSTSSALAGHSEDEAVLAPVVDTVDTDEIIEEENALLDIVLDVPQEHELPELTLPKAGPAGKKSKAKGSRSKKVKPPSPSVAAMEQVPSLTIDIGRGAFEVTDSPAFGLALMADELNHGSAPSGEVRGSPSMEDDAFEFHPVPSSFEEIMSPMPPQDVAPVTTCLHRAGRKAGIACNSCMSERKVADLMQDVLQSIDQRADAPPPEEISASVVLEQVTTTVKTDVHLTPVKNADENKENSLNNVDLNTLSLRKLHKELAQKKSNKGLSKRNNGRLNARLAEAQ